MLFPALVDMQDRLISRHNKKPAGDTKGAQMKFIFVLLFFIGLFFLGCSSSVPDDVLDKCNKEQTECNSQANKSSCGVGDSACVKKMLTDPNWSAGNFNQKLKQCDTDYQKCLGLKK